jgi:hypothetical protein
MGKDKDGRKEIAVIHFDSDQECSPALGGTAFLFAASGKYWRLLCFRRGVKVIDVKTLLFEWQLSKNCEHGGTTQAGSLILNVVDRKERNINLKAERNQFGAVSVKKMSRCVLTMPIVSEHIDICFQTLGAIKLPAF